MFGQSFFPNKENDISPKNIEESSHIKAPLLGSPLHEDENEIMMNFIRNPFNYKHLIDQNGKAPMLRLKEQINHHISIYDKEKFFLRRKVFILLMLFLILSTTLVLIIYSYYLENLSLGCGAMTFVLCFMVDLYYIVKKIQPNFSQIFSVLVALIIGIFVVFAALLSLSNEDIQQKEMSESFLSILGGFVIGLLILKPISKVLES